MKKSITFLLAIFVCFNVFAQAFSQIQVHKKGNEANFFIDKTCYRALFSTNSDTHKPKIVFSGNASLNYNSIYSDATLDFSVFRCKKANLTYMIIHNYADMSRGCDIFLLDKNTYTYIAHLNVAAYTRIGNEKMNYNSILPYLSIVNTTQKIYFSFETPLVVLDPGETTERVLSSKQVHYTLENNILSKHIEGEEE